MELNDRRCPVWKRREGERESIFPFKQNKPPIQQRAEGHQALLTPRKGGIHRSHTKQRNQRRRVYCSPHIPENASKMDCQKLCSLGHNQNMCSSVAGASLHRSHVGSIPILKGYSTFFGNKLILPLPQRLNSWVLPFQMYSADFLIFRRISVTRPFLVSVTSKVYFFPSMEVNETRNGLVTDILLNIRKSAEWIWKR